MGQIQPATNQCQDECLPLTDAVEELRQLLKTHCNLVGSVENNHVCASFVGKNTRESLWQEWGWMRASVVSLSSIVSVINASSTVHGHVSMWVHLIIYFIYLDFTYLSFQMLTTLSLDVVQKSVRNTVHLRLCVTHMGDKLGICNKM